MSRLLPLLVTLGLVAPTSLPAAPRVEDAKKYAADLKSKDAKVRVTALKELGKLGSVQRKLTAPYVTDILSALGDSDPKVRAEAARTLGLIDPPDHKAAITRIADLLKDEKSQDARQGQAMGLGALGGTTADPELKREARQALLAARKKATDKREQKVIQAAMLLITGPKKKQ